MGKQIQACTSMHTK